MILSQSEDSFEQRRADSLALVSGMDVDFKEMEIRIDSRRYRKPNRFDAVFQCHQ